MADKAHTGSGIRLAEALPLLALGMIAGVSFLAQPAKFLTPELSLAQLVSVGNTLFEVSHRVQWGWLLLLAVVVPRAKVHKTLAWALLTGFALTLSFQQFGLMPPLQARLMELRLGHQPEPSLLHVGYIVLEVVKLGTLCVLGALRSAGMPSRTAINQ